MRLLVIGYAAWDVIFPLAETPPPDTKTEVDPLVACGGGPGANAAVALRRLGAEVALAAVFGDDAESRAHREALAAEGVDLSPSIVVPGGRTPRAVIRVDPRDGARRIYWSRGDLPRLDPDAVDPARLDGLDLLHGDPHEAPAMTRLAAAARERGLPVTLDAGSVRPGTRELVAVCTDVIGAETFAPAFTGETDPGAALAALRAAGPARAGTTRGAEGVIGLDAAGTHRIPAFPVDAVDTTGAGDAFHAGYAFGRVLGEDFPSALRRGAAVAALSCRAYGGRDGLPTRDETEAVLAGVPVGDAAAAGGPHGRG